MYQGRSKSVARATLGPCMARRKRYGYGVAGVSQVHVARDRHGKRGKGRGQADEEHGCGACKARATDEPHLAIGLLRLYCHIAPRAHEQGRVQIVSLGAVQLNERVAMMKLPY